MREVQHPIQFLRSYQPGPLRGAGNLRRSNKTERMLSQTEVRISVLQERTQTGDDSSSDILLPLPEPPPEVVYRANSSQEVASQPDRRRHQQNHRRNTRPPTE